MSEHDDDRDLEDFLNRQSPVSKAWREATAEQRAPEALDAAILAAAAEVRPVTKPKPLPRLRRWRVPIGLAASLVIGVGVLREAQRDDLAREELLGEQAAVAASVEYREQSESRQRSDENLEEKAERERLLKEYMYDHQLSASRSDGRLSMPTIRPRPAAPAYSEPAPAPQSIEEMPAAESVAARPPPPMAPAEAAVADESRVLRRKPMAAAAAAAPLPSRASGADWQPARYRDLPLGQATVDDTLRRYGAPEVDTDTKSNEALLPDGRRAHRLLDYGRKLDPRGRLRLYFDAGSTALAWANLVLDPPLSLAAVQAAEGLVGEGIARAADSPPCNAQPTPPGEPAWPQIRSWPGQGVQLLLAGPDRVVEISYLERCR